MSTLGKGLRSFSPKTVILCELCALREKSPDPS